MKEPDPTNSAGRASEETVRAGACGKTEFTSLSIQTAWAPSATECSTAGNVGVGSGADGEDGFQCGRDGEAG